MTDIRFRSDMTVELIQSAGDDAGIVRAARVSTGTENKVQSPEETSKFIDFLMKNRHGTPFEHNSLTFRIEAPIFVFREWHRHRIGWSYNEESARYKKMSPTFWVPPKSRPLRQEGKPGAYTFVEGTDEQKDVVNYTTKGAYEQSYSAYEEMLSGGVAREVARAVLPVATYSSMYATCNTRSLMSFLSLRTKDPVSKFPSFPQQEIEACARQMEIYMVRLFPITHDAFQRHGRVSP